MNARRPGWSSMANLPPPPPLLLHRLLWFAVIAAAATVPRGTVAAAQGPCAETALCESVAGGGTAISYTCVDLEPEAAMEFQARQCGTDVWDYLVQDENANVYAAGEGTGHGYLNDFQVAFTLEPGARNLTFTLTCHDSPGGCLFQALLQVDAGDQGTGAFYCPLERAMAQGWFSAVELRQARELRARMPALLTRLYYGADGVVTPRLGPQVLAAVGAAVARPALALLRWVGGAGAGAA